MNYKFYEDQWKYFRNEDFNKRYTDFHLSIDPGFVHHSKIETILGQKGKLVLDDALRKNVNHSLPEGLQQTQIDHVYTNIFTTFCKVIGIKSFGQVISEKKGRLFCSTEILEPCDGIYDKPRIKTEINKYWNLDTPVYIEFSTNKVRSDTLRSRLEKGDQFSLIAEFHTVNDKEIIFDPIIIGSPWFTADNDKIDLTWNGYVHNEVFIEDIDEFSKVKDVDVKISEVNETMPNIPEKDIKSAFCSILGIESVNDWGGEQSDIYTANMHIKNKRYSAAFILKGPANFKPMTLNHLGKNNDQIVRLSNEPADLLIVQHCTTIEQAVRSTLRAFSVQPSNPRKYCLIDGIDTLRILKAYKFI